jgi:hypothetical protein
VGISWPMQHARHGTHACTWDWDASTEGDGTGANKMPPAMRRLLADGDGHSLACALDAYWGAGGCFRGVVIGRIRWSSAPPFRQRTNQTAGSHANSAPDACMQLYCTHACHSHCSGKFSCTDTICLFLRFVSKFRSGGLRGAHG